MEAHIDFQEDTALLVDLLIEAGSAEVEATDIDGHTALHFCCLNGLTEAAKVLVCCHLSKTLVRRFLRENMQLHVPSSKYKFVHSFLFYHKMLCRCQKKYVWTGKLVF